MKKLITILIVAFLSACSTTNESESLAHAYEPDMLSEYMAKNWYVSEPMSIEDIEQQAMEERERYRKQTNSRKDVPMVPFGFANDRWEEFKSKVQEGDEIRKLSSPPEYWSRLAGWEGFALVRGEYIVWQMMTGIN